MMQRISADESNRTLMSQPYSSSTIWTWLRGNHRHRHLAAIVFSTTAAHWPADLYVEIDAAEGEEWIADLPRDRVSTVPLDFSIPTICTKSNRIIVELRLQVQDEEILGQVLHRWQRLGHVTWSHYDESIEIVFPAAVKPSSIERIVPLYRKNKLFKEHRGRPIRETPTGGVD
jgi:hypothetical protein